MKPFNLPDYISNPNIKIQTKSGLNVRIICTDFHSGSEYYLIGLVQTFRDDTVGETIHTFSKDGKFLIGSKNNEMDLYII